VSRVPVAMTRLFSSGVETRAQALVLPSWSVSGGLIKVISMDWPGRCVQPSGFSKEKAMVLLAISSPVMNFVRISIDRSQNGIYERVMFVKTVIDGLPFFLFCQEISLVENFEVLGSQRERDIQDVCRVA